MSALFSFLAFTFVSTSLYSAGCTAQYMTCGPPLQLKNNSNTTSTSRTTVMSEETLKTHITTEMKAAMRAKNKPRLSTIRLIQAEIKRIEVDERIELNDTRVLAILDKMSKQRRDSLSQFKDAGRDDLAEQEQSELDVIAEFLPAALTEEELQTLIDKAVADSGAQAMSDMGKVMAIIKPLVQGRADMGAVSQQIKARLS